MFALALYIVFHVASGANDSRSFPFKISAVVSDKCQLLKNLTNVEVELNAANLLLNERYGRSACTCGGLETWRRIAYLDMSDQSQQCPSGWSQIEDPVRACAGKSRGCHSASFSTDQFTYNHVCGRVMAYQKGSPDGFDFWDNSIKTLEGPYMNGVSLTYGAAGSRQHIWSFVAAVFETNNPYQTQPTCECTNTNYNWPHKVPSFIGNNYFCDSGNRGPGYQDITYLDDPLWDGNGCGPDSTCCQLNNPPWFCTSLPQPTSDDLELRICSDERNSNEDTYVYLVEMYVASR